VVCARVWCVVCVCVCGMCVRVVCARVWCVVCVRVCVCVGGGAGTQSEIRMRHIAISGLSGSPVFFLTVFEKRLLSVQYVF